MNDEHVATYIYDPFLDYGVYDKKGNCVNEGNPFYQFPTWQEVFDSYYMEQVN